MIRLPFIGRLRFSRVRDAVRAYRATAPVRTAIARLVLHDGLEIAGSMAFSTLLSLFPFMIFLFALATFVDLEGAVREGIGFSLGAFPDQIAEALMAPFGEALSVKRPDLLTLGAVLALWSASNGVESLRMGLNRAYDQAETRSVVRRRAQSLGIIVLGAGLALVMGYLTITSTMLWGRALESLPHPLSDAADFVVRNAVTRYLVAGAALVVLLSLAHLWLPTGRRAIRDALPGVIVTSALWIALAAGFGVYLANYASYATVYGSLGGVAAAMVFFYFTAASILFGAELNRALMAARVARQPRALPSPASAD